MNASCSIVNRSSAKFTHFLHRAKRALGQWDLDGFAKGADKAE